MAVLAVLLYVCVASITNSYTSRSREPECVSKFDYDYKMLQKLLELDNKQKELEELVDEQRDILRQLELQRKNYGSTYTRWGKTTCPGNGSSLLYAGYMAGAHHKHAGSGANYLCLTAQPQWGHYEENIKSGDSIYGVEYEFWDHRNSGASKFFGQNVVNKNVPCAVCHVSRGTSIMIPGRKECFGGWTNEYNGYLVSGHRNHKMVSEFVCLDERVDFIDGSENNDDESLLYFVDGVCGKSLPCPPMLTAENWRVLFVLDRLCEIYFLC